MERFTRAAEIENSINEGTKTIARTRTVALLRPHFCGYRGLAQVRSASGADVPNDWRIAIDPANFAVAQINHYFVKSRAEWTAKLQRGYSWIDENRAPLFAMCDRNDCEDRTILSWKVDTERWMARLGTSKWDHIRQGLDLFTRGVRQRIRGSGVKQ